MKNKLFSRSNYKTPWFVCSISIIIITQFILINYKDHFKSINPETFTLFSAPDTIDIYDGQYWGVFTNNFIHIYWSQLLINLAGIWFFGAFIERREGFLKLVGLIILATVIPTLGQLAITSEAGIGLSDVNYTLFGYILMKSNYSNEFKLKGRYFFLMFMVGLLAYLNYYNLTIEDVYKTESMTIGLFLGLLTGYLNKFSPYIKYSVIYSLFLISISTMFYAPWSSEWQVYKGINEHLSKKPNKAIYYYKKALRLDKNNEQAKENLDLLTVDKLKSKAYKYHMLKKYKTAKKIYLQILEIYPSDEWTIENMKELP